MAKERELSNEEILYLLIHLREKANENGIKEISVNRERCKQIGILNYELKDTKKRKASYLFLINETQDGEEVNLIYDEKGKLIAWKGEEDKEFQISKEIDLNNNILNQQLSKIDESERALEENEEHIKNSDDTTKAGNGRDLASKEHEDKKEEQKDEKPKEKKKNQQNVLINYKGEISIERKAKIKLNEIVNGYYLWEILQIEEKYKGKMPKGLSEKSFRYGYLTTVDAKEIQAAEEKAGKEPKPRKQQKVMAICTDKGDIIELDETILEPEKQLSNDEQMVAEQTALRYRDGKEALRPQNQHELTKKASYKILDVNDKFGVAENWGIQVDINTELQRNGTIPIDGNIEEISLWQESRNNSNLEREKQQKRYVQKFEAINEPSNKTKDEKEQQKDLREKNPNEALDRRKEHFEELTKIAFAKYPKLKEYYNNSDIKKKVVKYHNQGLTDEQVLEELENELNIAENVEHEFRGINMRRPH